MWKWCWVLAVLLSCARPPCEPPYSCPESADGGVVFVDCMPPNDGAPECSGQCHAWLAENCSQVRFVF